MGGSLLFVDHPAYDGKWVSVTPETVNMRPRDFLESELHMPACGRTWIRDWPVEDFEAYDQDNPIEGGSFYKDHKTGEFVVTGPFAPISWESAAAAAAEFIAAAPDSARSVKDLLGESKVQVLGLPEPDTSAGAQLRRRGGA